MSEGPDLTHFVQHRQLDVYAQGMSRRGYAYGVDLRRSRWLSSSNVGNALVRAVDRAWPRLAAHLMEEAFVDGRAAPTALLREIAIHMNTLQAPLPTVRLLRREQRGRWPLVTALGATRGGALWLVLDAEALMAIDPPRRAFLLGSGLGHLHCDHAVFFSAHLLANRREGTAGIRTLKSALVPWTKVMMFSADRAGLIACSDLDAAISVIESPPVPVGEGESDLQAAPPASWLPPLPDPTVRVTSLEEFARSAVFARVKAVRARQRELARQLVPPLRATPDHGTSDQAGEAQETAPGPDAEPDAEPIHVPADAWSLARVDARLTERLHLL